MSYVPFSDEDGAKILAIMLVIFIFFTVFIVIFSEYYLVAFVVSILLFIAFRTVYRVYSYRRKLRKFLLDSKRKRDVVIKSSRWGEMLAVNVSGFVFACDGEKKESIEAMYSDVTVFLHTLFTTGKMPMGLLFSEIVAQNAKTFGFSEEDTKKIVFNEIMSDIAKLVDFDMGKRVRSVDGWILAVQKLEKVSETTLYHRTVIQSVVSYVERVTQSIQSAHVS